MIPTAAPTQVPAAAHADAPGPALEASDTGLDVVTGAFSYSGSVIAQLLLDKWAAVVERAGR